MSSSGDLNLTNESIIPQYLWDEAGFDAPRVLDVLTQIAHFLDQLGFTQALTALLREAVEQKLNLDLEAWENGLEEGKTHPLMELWAEWFVARDAYPSILPSSTLSSPKKETPKRVNVVSGAKDDIEQDVVDEEDTSSSDDAASEVNVAANTSSKRKRVLTPPSSDDDESEESSTSESEESDGDDDSSSDESDTRPVKRAKTAASDNEIHSDKSHNTDSNSDSESDDSSSDSSESGAESSADLAAASSKSGVQEVKAPSTASSSSSNDSVESEDSSSGAESTSESDASSESSSESDSEESDASDSESVLSTPSPSGKVQKSVTATALNVGPGSSSSSTTLEAASPPPTKKSKSKHAKKIKGNPPSEEKPLDTLIVADETSNGMHPDRVARMPPSATPAQSSKTLPATKANIAALKKENVPFSRIPADTKVDPRFASNEYVSYDYADRAYQDLAVTKGKGFTKEKNKKKRGMSFRQKARLAASPLRDGLSVGLDIGPDDGIYDHDDDNIYGLKEDTFAFMSGCGFNPMSGDW